MNIAAFRTFGRLIALVLLVSRPSTGSAQTAADAPVTKIDFLSQPGDYIGGGVNQTITPIDGNFSATRPGQGVHIGFDGDTWWDLTFVAPQNAILVPGTYEGATRYPFQSPTKPGLDVSGDGRGCNMLTGRFVVLEVAYGAGGEVDRFAADFEQHCEGGTPALFGSVRFNSTLQPAPPTQIAVNAGNNQTAPTGAAVAIAPSVIVRDGSNSPVSGVLVTFAVTSGGGSITGATQTTNALGIATVGSWTLGNTAGSGNNTLTVVFEGLTENPATFTASAQSGAAGVSVGRDHACALMAGGGVRCWGDNSRGQLGDGTLSQRNTPVDVYGLTSGVLSVAAGQYHTCALVTGGSVKCWGNNADGQLGDGSTTARPYPTLVSGLTGAASISAGDYHTCAVTSGEALKCWGDNLDGQLGDGSLAIRSTPVSVLGLSTGVARVSAGGFHTCALTTTGGLKCWGYNGYGALGDGTTASRVLPGDVTGLTTGVAQLSAGYYQTCAVTTGGAAKCWGNNLNGQLGDGTLTPRANALNVSGLGSGVAQISTGRFHTCAVTTTGGVKCWGSNLSGKLGDGTTTQRTTPVNVFGLTSGVAGVSAGTTQTCAVTVAGGVLCWGDNALGQLGDGTTTPRPRPAPVSGLARISVDDPAIFEGGTGYSIMAFTVSLSAPSSTAVTVNYATTNGTAIAGVDYTAASGVLTIPAGSASKRIALLVKGDGDTEPDETFTLTLSGVSGGDLGKSVGTAAIVNDDPAPVATTVTQYRLYHDGTKEHLYTTDVNEYDVLGTQGWIQEGVAYKMLTNGVYNGVATVPLFRLYHPGIQQHHWTTDSNETTILSGTPSWFYEAAIGYLLPTQVAGSVPLYRLALPNPALHLWTTDLNEYNTLATRGWIKEGVIGYVIP